jgi:hypothetical protein
MLFLSLHGRVVMSLICVVYLFRPRTSFSRAARRRESKGVVECRLFPDLTVDLMLSLLCTAKL